MHRNPNEGSCLVPSRSIVAVVALVALAGCAGGRTGAAPEDVLFLRAGADVTLVRNLPTGEAFRLPNAVPSTDWSAVVRAVPNGDTTRVVAVDPPSGFELWARTVPGHLEVKVAAGRGRLVVLGHARGPGAYPPGRSSTKFVILRDDGSDPETIDLQGNFEAEAFSTDGRSLFVVEYLPADDPVRYQVRRLDLDTHEVVGVYSVDAHLQEAMRGTARIQAASPDGRRLYTLYTLQLADGTTRAFVHVLSLDELWAHCVDLPPEFATGAETDIALSVTPDGHRLFVADAGSGSVAEVDTQALMVGRTTTAAFGTRVGSAQAVADPNGTLYLGKGRNLIALDVADLATDRSWEMDGRITGIQSANDGSRLYVGLRKEIEVIDTRTGELLEALDPEVVERIEQLGQSTRMLTEERTSFNCAC